MADNNLLSGIAAALGGYGGARQQGNPLLGAYDAYQTGVEEDRSRQHAANMMMMATGAGILAHPAGAGGSVMSSVGQGFTQGLGVYQEITKMEQDRALKDAQLQYNALKAREDAEEKRQALQQTILDRQQRAQEADATRRYQIDERSQQQTESRAQRAADRASDRESRESMHADSIATQRAIAADRIANRVEAPHMTYQKGDDGTLIAIDNVTGKSHLVEDPRKPGELYKVDLSGSSGSEADKALAESIRGFGPTATPAAPAAAAVPGAGVTVGRFKVFKE